MLTGRLKSQFPGLEICGAYSPPFRRLSNEEDARAVGRINEARPDIVWVSLGCPAQEFWMSDHIKKVDASVMIGVGQAFDLLAGVKKRAPAWMQNHGFEWLFRFCQEPRRLWKRYLVYAPQFVFYVMLEELGWKRFD